MTAKLSPTSSLSTSANTPTTRSSTASSRRHLNTQLAFTSYCRATTDTDAPATSVSATIRRFPAKGHNCRAFRRSPTTRLFDSVHLALVDTIDAANRAISAARDGTRKGGSGRTGNCHRERDSICSRDGSTPPQSAKTALKHYAGFRALLLPRCFHGRWKRKSRPGGQLLTC